jgi:hypothetical protein
MIPRFQMPEGILYDNLTKSLFEVYMSGGHHACGVTGVTPTPAHTGPARAD